MPNTEYRILLLEDNAVNALVVRKTLEACHAPSFHISHADTLVKALDMLAGGGFDGALVDLDLPDSSGIETFLAIRRSAPDLAVVILSGCDDDTLAMKAVELGAQDYLSKNGFSGNEVLRALQYGIIRSRKAAEEKKPQPALGNVLAFLGSKGGVGATTLACHAAREWKRQQNEPVLLTGIDSNAAGVAYLMKSATQYTVADAAQNLHRLDADLWKALVHTTSDGVDVLPPPGAANFTGQLEPDRLRHVLRFARGVYPRVILDLGVLDPLSLSLLEEVAQIVVVAGEDLPALWEAGRLLTRLSQLGLSNDNILFVLNQKKRKGGVPPHELEKALNYKIYSTVNACWMEEAELMAGGRFIDDKSPIRKDVARFVSKLLGKESPQPNSGFSLSRLVRG